MKIELINVSKQLNKVDILEDINFTFESGKIYGLKGKNGSGKTMLMRLISGLMYATKGKVLVDGKILGKDIEFPQNMGLLIENPSFLNEYTGFQNLKMIASIQNKIDDKKIKNTIKSMGLNPDDTRKYKKYSLGMKQRLGITCALMENPDLIILDEPTNAIDEQGLHLIRDILTEEKSKNKLIIISSHDLEELEFIADEIIIMAEGKIQDVQKRA